MLGCTYKNFSSCKCLCQGGGSGRSQSCSDGAQADPEQRCHRESTKGDFCNCAVKKFKTYQLSRKFTTIFCICIKYKILVEFTICDLAYHIRKWWMLDLCYISCLSSNVWSYHFIFLDAIASLQLIMSVSITLSKKQRLPL